MRGQELGFEVRAFVCFRVAQATVLGCGAGADDHHDAEEMDGRRGLVQDDQPEDDADGGFERHQ